ncbi:MAG: hypothetical protein AVDCRST_MAG89-1761, partial [uncultured Gemmatimonadetes bacterium]
HSRLRRVAPLGAAVDGHRANGRGRGRAPLPGAL